MFNGRRQPSHGGTSRMMREYQVRICERLGAKFPGPTRPIATDVVPMGMSGATRSGHRRAAKKCIEQHVRSRLAGLTTFRSYQPGPSRGRTRTTLVSFQFVICSTSLSAAQSCRRRRF